MTARRRPARTRRPRPARPRGCRATAFLATSLDGYIARADGGLDWLPEAPEDHGYDALMARVDALVMGRGTYDTVLGFGAWPYGRKPVVVLSHRPLPPRPEGATVSRMAGRPATIVRKLADRGLRRLYVDGGRTVTTFLDAGLLDEVVITRVPVVLGSGIPLFGPTRGDISLAHEKTTAYPSGLVQSTYRVR